MNGAYQGNSGHVNGTYASSMAGGARPQTAEIIKTFGERCPEVVINNKQEKADYVVVLDHEGGKGVVRRRNKIAVFNRDGDAIVSHSTRSLGNSVKDGCAAIVNDWAQHLPGTQASALNTEHAASKVAADNSPAIKQRSNVAEDNSAPLRKSASAQFRSSPASSDEASGHAGTPTALAATHVPPQKQESIKKTDPRTQAGASQGGYLGATSTQNPRVRHDGVLLSGVEAGGPAYQAGLEAGDVIISVDGTYIYTVSELSTYIQKHAPGSRIQVKYLRGANFYDTYVILTSTARF